MARKLFKTVFVAVTVLALLLASELSTGLVHASPNPEDYFYSGAVNDSALAIEYYEKVIQLMQLSSSVNYTSEIDYYRGLISGLKGEN